jgi:hypothetical protein
MATATLAKPKSDQAIAQLTINTIRTLSIDAIGIESSNFRSTGTECDGNHVRATPNVKRALRQL